MYLSRAEDLIEYWAAEAKGRSARSSAGKPMSMREIASQFGGSHHG